MKRNYKRTILVGFAFFLICAFWQIYDVTIAMTLTSKFGLSQTASGVVMALDNVLVILKLSSKIMAPTKGLGDVRPSLFLARARHLRINFLYSFSNII